MSLTIEGNFCVTELLNAQAHIWNHIFNFVNSMSLKCAVQLGIPDIIHKHGRPMTLPEIINGLPISKAKAHCVHRLMRILTHSKFFMKANIYDNDEKAGYWLTPSSRLLLTHEPFSLKPLLLAKLDPFLMEPWHHLSKWFVNDHHMTAFDLAHGRRRWDNDGGHRPSFDDLFNEAMNSDSRLVARVVIGDFKQMFQGLESIVDVGGGRGAMGKAIADAFPDLKCIVLDLPHVIHGLEGDANLTYAGANMFEFIPPANAVLMKWILHCWGDEESVKILKKCKEAIPGKDEGGKVMIIEMVLPNNNHRGVHVNKAFDQTHLLFDMEDMVLVSGRERTENEWAKLFFDAGFTTYNIFPILGLRSLIEVYP